LDRLPGSNRVRREATLRVGQLLRPGGGGAEGRRGQWCWQPAARRRRGGARGRKQRGGGKAVENPQATRGSGSSWRWALRRR
jgi:hypothetical protein